MNTDRGQSTPAAFANSETAGNQLAGNASRTTALLTAVTPTPNDAARRLRPMASAICDAVVMAALYPQKVVPRKSTIGCLSNKRDYVDIPVMLDTETEFAEIGARLERLRTGLSDLSQKAWAQKHGFPPARWNNWERGIRRIPVDDAEKLCDRYGLTLDALYRGRLDGLPESLRKVL